MGQRMEANRRERYRRQRATERRTRTGAIGVVAGRKRNAQSSLAQPWLKLVQHRRFIGTQRRHRSIARDRNLFPCLYGWARIQFRAIVARALWFYQRVDRE